MKAPCLSIEVGRSFRRLPSNDRPCMCEGDSSRVLQAVTPVPNDGLFAEPQGVTPGDDSEANP